MTFQYRPALDGLRALAVLGVVAYHLNVSWLPGGFLGVDLFFVLSGFLITSLLLIEHESTGTVSLQGFWTRRVRRLLPASLLVLLVVVVVTAVFGGPLDQAARRPEILSALVYLVNWQFILSGQSYFEGFADVSPIRHYWSLAIEEQFYLLWPLAVFLLLRWTKGRRLWIPAVIAAVLSGMAMAVLYDPANLSRSYFGSDTRIHQILAGCLLAMLARTVHWARVLRFLRPLLPVTFALVFLEFFVVQDSSPFYYLGGAVVFGVLVAMMVAGLESESGIRTALSWAPLVWIGQISYGLYLWHWPLIRWLNVESTGLGGLSLTALRLGATFAAATLSYYLLELPIRRGRIAGFKVDRRTVLRQVPVATGSLAVIAVLTLSPQVPEWMQPPSVDQVAAATATTVEAATGQANPSPSSDQVVVGVVGDSVMVSLLPGVRELARERDWQLVEGALQACPLGREPLYDYEGGLSPYYEDICRPGVPAAHDGIAQAHPDVLLWHDLQSSLPRRDASGELLEPGSDPWIEDVVTEWQDVLSTITDADTTIVMIYPPLRSQDALGCEESVRVERCLTIQDQDRSIRLAADRLLDDPKGKAMRVVTLDDLLCPGGYPCPGEVEGMEARLSGNDQTHFTEQGASLIKDRLLAAIQATSSPFASSE